MKFLSGHTDSNHTFCPLFQSGVRPLIKPSEEPHTVIINGRTDNRNYKEEQTDQYKLMDMTELMTEEETCAIPYPTADELLILKESIGPVAGFVDNMIVVCGGFSETDKKYHASCQTQSGNDLIFWTHYYHEVITTRFLQ